MVPDGYLYSRQPHTTVDVAARLVHHHERAFLGATRVQFEIRPDNSLCIHATHSNVLAQVKDSMSDRVHELKQRQLEVVHTTQEFAVAVAAAERLEEGAGEEMLRLAAINGRHKQRIAELEQSLHVCVEAEQVQRTAILLPGVQTHVSFLSPPSVLVWCPQADLIAPAVETKDTETVLHTELVGRCYEAGIGVPVNKSEAKRMYALAAESGDAHGQAWTCLYGDAKASGLDSAEAAVHVLRREADQGAHSAQNMLGVCYEQGKGVAQDHKEAVRWFQLAADQGHIDAQSSLRRARARVL